MGVGEQRVRIVGGRFRGRPIAAPKGITTRPTTDRVREALMSVLASRLGGFEGAVVLDAFAGSGALGLETLSRGADRVTFVERDRNALRALRDNIAALGVERDSVVHTGDTFALAKRGVPGCPFTLILLDPPYTLDQTEVAGFLGGLTEAGAVAPGAVVSLEHAADVTVVWPKGFEPVSTKRYGSTAIDIAVHDEGEG